MSLLKYLVPSRRLHGDSDTPAATDEADAAPEPPRKRARAHGGIAHRIDTNVIIDTSDGDVAGAPAAEGEALASAAAAEGEPGEGGVSIVQRTFPTMGVCGSRVGEIGSVTVDVPANELTSMVMLATKMMPPTSSDMTASAKQRLLERLERNLGMPLEELIDTRDMDAEDRGKAMDLLVQFALQNELFEFEWAHTAARDAVALVRQLCESAGVPMERVVDADPETGPDTLMHFAQVQEAMRTYCEYLDDPRPPCNQGTFCQMGRVCRCLEENYENVVPVNPLGVAYVPPSHLGSREDMARYLEETNGGVGMCIVCLIHWWNALYRTFAAQGKPAVEAGRQFFVSVSPGEFRREAVIGCTVPQHSKRGAEHADAEEVANFVARGRHGLWASAPFPTTNLYMHARHLFVPVEGPDRTPLTMDQFLRRQQQQQQQQQQQHSEMDAPEYAVMVVLDISHMRMAPWHEVVVPDLCEDGGGTSSGGGGGGGGGGGDGANLADTAAGGSKGETVPCKRAVTTHISTQTHVIPTRRVLAAQLHDTPQRMREAMFLDSWMPVMRVMEDQQLQLWERQRESAQRRNSSCAYILPQRPPPSSSSSSSSSSAAAAATTNGAPRESLLGASARLRARGRYDNDPVTRKEGAAVSYRSGTGF